MNKAQILKRLRTNCRPRQRSRGMNKTEEAHAKRLEIVSVSGDILWYGYECLKFRLANKTWYTPDFVVLLSDGQIEVHEVKGTFFEDDSRVKIKVFAEQYTFLRVKCYHKLSKKQGGGWKVEEF